MTLLTLNLWSLVSCVCVWVLFFGNWGCSCSDFILFAHTTAKSHSRHAKRSKETTRKI